ncbi:unnamed protein product [marine sediment metagenome]|uniref:Uncharacterized protein n=1 Tax=marine sediment metagenome TaxID=412755 RepID=X1A656_9ZZZZ
MGVLKTLKDFETNLYYAGNDIMEHPNKYVLKDLRQVAREWIEYYRKEINILEERDKEYEAEDIIADRPPCARPDISNEVAIMRGGIAVLKHFFNLEDD